MGDKQSKFLFDKRDHELIRIVNAVQRVESSARFARKFYFPYLHPHGIKEMTETKGLRAAYAVAQLLSSLEIGGVDDRINALRSLRHEVIDIAEGPMPKNTARVLLQIMKDLVRAHGDYRRQLELAHDFRRTASGKPRLVRQHLRRYHLLEMPEEWNQVAFDDHVHDANTKGRKSSTHLIMDAWIKGIRRLRVIHYNYIEPRFAAELLEAARILEIDIRIGIEFSSRFRDKYVQLIWVPRGFTDAQSFLCFLAEPPVMQHMEAGRRASRYQQQYVMDLLQKFNEVHRLELNQAFGVDLPPIKDDEFLAFVGIGQKSKLHLSKFIHTQLLRVLQGQVAVMRKEYPKADSERRRQISDWIQSTNAQDLESLVDACLEPEKNKEIANPDIPADGPDCPELLRLKPFELLSRLALFHAGYRVTLNLSNLMVEDVLELIYDCQGMITRLEIFNLKDYAAGKTAHISDISRLMQAINEGSAIHLKQVTRDIIDRLKRSGSPAKKAQIDKLTTILHDIDTLKSFYNGRPLKARIGSDSTGRSSRIHGMGLAIKETLPKRAQRSIKRDRMQDVREIIPIRMTAYKKLTFIPKKGFMPTRQALYWLAALLPANGWLGLTRRDGWEVEPTATRMANPGNIVTLGGVQKGIVNGLYLNPPEVADRRIRFRWRDLNTHLQNALKVVIGFIPAFATFALTKDWWLLAYCGAFIWFGITGLRNILQSVLGGGGFKRSPLLNWNDYISWTRITDSLLYTGFSVPLLDYLVKTLILDRAFGITTATHPVLLYTFMALANGIYLSSHNILRGLPKGAVYGNFFRSILSIPLAVGLNVIIGMILTASGVAGVNLELQKWAAIISKAASDIVAGVIEGLTDRHKNIRSRLREYQNKFAQLFDIYAQLELLYPEVRTFKILDRSDHPQRKANAEARDLEKIIMIHALDLLYFWLYQPRSRTALRQFLRTLTEDERHILVSSQFTLLRHREISQLFIDGILGDNFPRPLSFYLSRYEDYLKDVKRLIFDEQLIDADPSARPDFSVEPAAPLGAVKDYCETSDRRTAN
ncbi:MAG: hypothetical protein JSW26_23980 [Desulfobacterales bacterium]|nr:MAG: hypothetical protein JSW26_23980 [Desulfobacterales bacterium]